MISNEEHLQTIRELRDALALISSLDPHGVCGERARKRLEQVEADIIALLIKGLEGKQGDK